MRWTSTRNKSILTNLEEVLFQGLSPDGGLYMPDTLPNKIVTGHNTLTETATDFLSLYTNPDVGKHALQYIVEKALNFPLPVKKLDDTHFVLELFHGPTLAFKDVGARVMAGLMEYFHTGEEPLTILAATSGDTGSAVASAFHGKDAFRVVLLFPSGKVSEIQDRQLTTFGGNVTALEVDGTFDDCQKLVKEAFSDTSLRGEVNLTSANSINIGRWLPQAVYYLHAWNQMQEFCPGTRPVVSVPSGNLGNVAAGLVSLRHGAQFSKLTAASNANKTFTDFIRTGKFRPRSSVHTLSNAMDVGNPSNFERIHALYEGDITAIKKRLESSSHNDEDTLDTIRALYQKYGYIADPHTAVGFLGLDALREREDYEDQPGLVLSTAHPAKFGDVIEKALGIKPDVPARLARCFEIEKSSISIGKNYDGFRDFLIEL